MQCTARQPPAVQAVHLDSPNLGQSAIFFPQTISSCFSRLNDICNIEKEHPAMSLGVPSSSHASCSLFDHMKVANSLAVSK